MPQRKICVVVNSRANYGRIKSVMQAISEHPRVDLQLIAGASALLHRFGNVADVMLKDGFQIDAKLYSIVEGENPITMAKSTGLAIIELATLFEVLRPDVVLTVADRFETLATAVAASYLNIGLAHTQGGEITGSIDESVRHAITKLAHIHFPATKLAAENVRKMGEPLDTIHVVGCPSIDAIKNIDMSFPNDLLAGHGVGAPINLEEPYLLVLQHPVTTEYGDGLRQIEETLRAVEATGNQAIWLWPNVDAGSDDIAKGIRRYRERVRGRETIGFFRNFEPENYARLLFHAKCIVGNSSSALREGAYLGVPAVNIGTRQQNREHGANVMFAGYDHLDILDKIEKQTANGRYESSTLYGDGTAGRKIVDALATANIRIQKSLAFPSDR
jgi:UDP-hydrolysing UDP-N-acetyl-D-glucosamine 2-epimerase